MVKRIRASNQQEFKAATSEGAVYGKYLGVYVYAELGKEELYRGSVKDDSNTQYKLFRNCRVFYAETLEDLRAGIFVHETDENILIVFH
ncbi:MAG: hypothetical protein JOZ78_10120 [Chroococcidiopsidaceae cyanobacterium CP_BM_ER_R8_30]|nr:hypothetical protein [Chroococcidiopsidaceae cyanobacterium CP_BM_ER_R8_30]